jgi:diketogulonate reductase-like aldo/keto reductase
MDARVFGGAQRSVPIIGQGTWNMEQDDRRQAVEAIVAGIDAGMVHIDTAELYGAGRVEELVAEAIAGRRDQLFLVSKVMPSNASYEGTLRACEKSLRRLKTDHLDVYLLHWPGSHPLEDTIRAFEKLLADGKIKAWGVSNFDVDELEQAKAIAGANKIACNQVLYHLEEREIEWDVAPWCWKNKIPIVAYSPFGSRSYPWSSKESARALEEIALEHGVTAHAVALAFLVREEQTFVIPKSSNAEHVRANAAAGDLKLTPEELKKIERAFPRGKRKGGLPTL